MPRLLLAAAALLLAPITLSMANPPSASAPAPATPPRVEQEAEGRRLSDADGRRLVAAALLVALEWGRR